MRDPRRTVLVPATVVAALGLLVAVLDRGRLLVSERDRARISIVADGRRRTVRFPSRKVWVSGETGLMSLAVVPGTRNRTFLTCSGWRTRGGPRIQVRRWRLSADGRRAVARGRVLGGIPTTSGRHGGCRLQIDPRTGEIWVGTGDSATTGVSRNLKSLGGKVLRLRADGSPSSANPWPRAASRHRRLVFTYGHRNVQGLARRPGGAMWSIEHGSYRDDEVNLLRAGRDFGWDPGPGYDESVPMTDHGLPGRQFGARWSSGRPTIATSGAAWVRGKRWGALDGTLAVAALAGERLVFMKFDDRGRFVRSWSPRTLRTHGRLRSVTRAPNGTLLVTTDNGGSDAVLRIRPRTAG
jgi:glucose/arabinose dehydrogenase